MTHDNISFKISASRYYCREIEAVISFLAILIFVSIPTNSLLLLIILGILSTILLVINAFLPSTKKQKRFNIITFNPTWVEIDKEIPAKINYVDIQKIVVYYHSTKGDQAKVMTMTGRENTIKIITKDGEKIVKNIWCENETDYWRLRSLRNFLKEKDVDIKMKGFLRDYKLVRWITDKRKNKITNL